MRDIPKVPRSFDSELDELLHPAAAFEHPRDVVSDPDLTINEKRAILSSWASDACVVGSAPHLRQRPPARRPVTFDDVVDALRSLDSGPLPKWKRVLRQSRQRSGGPDGGVPLS